MSKNTQLIEVLFKDTIVVHDGVTAGGIPLAKASEAGSGGLDPFLLMGA